MTPYTKTQVNKATRDEFVNTFGRELLKKNMGYYETFEEVEEVWFNLNKNYEVVNVRPHFFYHREEPTFDIIDASNYLWGKGNARKVARRKASQMMAEIEANTIY